MRTPTYYRGLTIGFEWAGLYIAGTKAQRREIRRKLHRMAESYNQLVLGIWEGFAGRAEQRADAILGGFAPRTINPHKLRRVLDRM
jgi:hypothetical protein